MSRAEKWERRVQVAILLAVGVSSGYVSFTHVHDWTVANSPAHMPVGAGWVNAGISELIPIAALIEIRRRKRDGKGIAFPVVLLILATALSLTAQLAVAKPGLSGGIVSAVPAIAFMGLVKLVLAGKAAKVLDEKVLAAKQVPGTAEVPVHKVPAQAVPVPTIEPVPVPAVPSTPAVPVPPVTPVPSTPAVPVPTEVPARPAAVPSTPEPAIVVPGPERRVRKPAGTGTPGDEVLKAKLEDVLKNQPQEVLTRTGTLGVKRVAAVLGTGPDRARRLIEEMEQRVPVPA